MKHLIKIESTAHGVLGVRHAGRDQQYCEAGELVTLKWQPDAGWGLKEACYKDAGGNVTPISLIPTKINGKDVVTFTMPDANIVVGGVFKRFAIEDWTGKDAAFSILGEFNANNLPTLDGFADAGKLAFVKDTRKYATWDGYGWTYMDGKPVTPRYLKFTANADGSSVGFCCWSEDYEVVDMGKNMQFSIDGGLTWKDYTIGVGEENVVAISIDEGESVMFRGVNENLAYNLEDEDGYIYTKCIIEGSVAAAGDVTSLLNGIGGDATLAEYCYSSMFIGCTGLTQAPALPATTLASGCYSSMFSDCTGISSHDVATLNDSQNTFQNNTSCASLTIHADTPPTIGNNTITGLKADCTIYVPAASVDAYKAKQYWSARAAYIQAIP